MGIGVRTGLLALAALACGSAQSGSTLRFCLRADPKTFDPLLAEEEPSDAVRFLTGGVLIRFNRQSQQLEPELAQSWTVRDHGKRIEQTTRCCSRLQIGEKSSTCRGKGTENKRPGIRSPICPSFRSKSSRSTFLRRRKLRS